MYPECLTFLRPVKARVEGALAITSCKTRRVSVADAVKLFEANAPLFPEDDNTHDSLGEGYAAAGRTRPSPATRSRWS
ncbi:MULTISPECIES: hypothetical protein [Myxococcus]|uniref:hypothetical protein n=1 Tax=Myxococcus TaxID=32 RepID=UPI00034D8C0F|nr:MULTISPECIES: hypothetical protein [Myxococcus]NOJ57591.1 hypothetical protein [Myxococcus xanthus]QPM77867.1 hypothetical protein I5Q59_26730 [Myxococcus xanthus]QVW66934.1 hypothetical protein JTM82_32080 [Myxococcus xanthus DZ2]QZZ53058.1 hypothetical protein MyxoNM_27985 [Myxococcus xanthus]UEO06938.1 hypothetical protein K1515_10715 [Myxococcus xanthus DZ2]